MSFCSRLALIVGLATLCDATLKPLEASSIVYSTLASDGTYIFTGYVVGVSGSFGIDHDVAAPFTPSMDAVLASFDVALGEIDPTNVADLFLMSDAGGIPDTVIESFAISGFPLFGTTNTALVHVNSVLQPQLLAGTTYWLVASVPDGLLAWNWSPLSGTIALTRNDSNPWEEMTPGVAFVVNGATSVPEPATFSLLGLGLAGMGARRWRQRKAS